MVKRGELDLSIELKALQKSAKAEHDEVLAEPLPTLSDAHTMQLKAFRKLRSLEAVQQAFNDLPLEVSFYVSMEGLREVARAPYHFSSLRRWLTLETWRPKDALLLLSGVCPKGALVDWSYENFMGAEIDEPRIRAATCLNAIHDRYDIPERSAWDDEIAELRQTIRKGKGTHSEQEAARLEQKLAKLLELRGSPEIVSRDQEFHHRSQILSSLSHHWFSGEHDTEKRYSPEYYLGWAAAREFTPEWLEWAKKQGLIDEHETVFRQPFFDPDGEDYPELLHIAVSAWQEARKGGAGTPKQRIERFLEQRYSTLPPTTRTLISQLANWQRTGGRPKS